MIPQLSNLDASSIATKIVLYESVNIKSAHKYLSVNQRSNIRTSANPRMSNSLIITPYELPRMHKC